MKTALKKVLAGALALTLVFAVVGCGKNKTGLDADGNYEVVWYTSEQPTPDADLVFEELNKYTAEKIGVKVKYTQIAPAEYAEKMQLLFASGEKIDLCFASTGTKFEQNARQLAYTDIGKLLDTVGKPIKELIPEYALRTFRVGGVQYGIPVLKDWGVRYSINVTRGKLDEIGMYDKAINATSIYDWAEIQAAWKKAHPDHYGILQRSNFNLWNAAMPIDAVTGSVIGGFMYDDYSKVVNVFDTDEAKKYFEEMHKWYNAGYIRADAATVTDDNDIYKVGNYLASMGEWLPYLNSQTVPETDPSFSVWCMGHSEPRLKTMGITACGTAIPASSLNPEKAMEFLTLLFTDEYVKNTSLLGIEGKHWVKKGDNNYDLPEGYTKKADTGYESIAAYAAGSRYISKVDPTFPADTWEKWQEFTDSAIPSEALGFNFDPAPVAGEIAAVQNVYNEYIPALQVGELDPAVKQPEAIAKMNSVGAERILEEAQKQYEQWKKDNNIK